MSKVIALINGRPRTQIQHCLPTNHGQSNETIPLEVGDRYVDPRGKLLQGGPFLVYPAIPCIDFVHCQIEFITNLPSWTHSKLMKIRFLGHLTDVSKCLDIFYEAFIKINYNSSALVLWMVEDLKISVEESSQGSIYCFPSSLT